MQLLSPMTPLVAAILLAPAWGFAAVALMGDAPGEWARGALIAWTALAAALIAGAGLQAAGGIVPWGALVLAFAAVMIGGPPGLGVAAVAVAALLLAGEALIVPWWLVAALAAPPAGLALRYALTA
jgi:hypothetical protein